MTRAGARPAQLPIHNAAHRLDRSAWARPDQVSLVYGQRGWTVAEAAFDTRRLAQLLARVGVSAGDRVMLVARNSPYHFLVYIACARLGAIFVPVSHRLTQAEIQRLVDFTSPRVVIADAESASRGAFASTGTVTHFAIDDDPAAGTLAVCMANGYLGLSAAMAAFDGTFVADVARERDVANRTDASNRADVLNRRPYPAGSAAIFHTSGSAHGKPRAVELTHENLWWSALSFRECFDYSGGDTMLVVAPLSHTGGFSAMALDLFVSGGRLVIHRHFEAGQALDAIDEHAVGIMFGVPTMYQAILKHRDLPRRDLSSWRLPIIGGASVPPELLAQMELAGLRAVVVWGMTETAGAGMYLPFGAGRPGAVGRPLPYTEVRIADTRSGEDADAGELLVRGPVVSPGYWHNEEHNAAAYVQGWLRTGDLAEVREGVVSIVGRMSDRITTGGIGVDPGEVERVLMAYPGVAEAAVVGLADETWGEIVAACLVLETGAAEPALDELLDFAGRLLARYKLPRRLFFMDRMARGPAGEPDRASVKSALNLAGPASPDAAASHENTIRSKALGNPETPASSKTSPGPDTLGRPGISIRPGTPSGPGISIRPEPPASPEPPGQ